MAHEHRAFCCLKSFFAGTTCHAHLLGAVPLWPAGGDQPDTVLPFSGGQARKKPFVFTVFAKELFVLRACGVRPLPRRPAPRGAVAVGLRATVDQLQQQPAGAGGDGVGNAEETPLPSGPRRRRPSAALGRRAGGTGGVVSAAVECSMKRQNTR